MRRLEVFRMAMASLTSHKLRSFLIVLGVTAGVASLMVVGAGLEGAEGFVVDSVSRALGSNSFILAKFARFGNVSDEEREKMIRRNKDIKLDDLWWLRRNCQNCAELTGELSGLQTVYRGSKEQPVTSIRGVTANMINIGTIEIETGRFFSPSEERGSGLVCVIGAAIKDELFPTRDPVNQTIKVRGRPLRVLGVLERQGSSFGQNLDQVVYVPVTTYQKIFGSRTSILIRGKARSRESFDEALDEVRVAMRVRHKLKPGEEDDFGLVSTKEINDAVDQFAGIVATAVIPITLISLVVGGIVIMNIMLVSVTERTFEIGIRKALGARRTDILYQFLIESLVVALLGGLAGLAIASGIAWLVETAAEFPMQISWLYITIAMGASSLVGVCAGLYPALKASKLDPVIAMTEGR